MARAMLSASLSRSFGHALENAKEKDHIDCCSLRALPVVEPISTTSITMAESKESPKRSAVIVCRDLGKDDILLGRGTGPNGKLIALLQCGGIILSSHSSSNSNWRIVMSTRVSRKSSISRRSS